MQAVWAVGLVEFIDTPAPLFGSTPSTANTPKTGPQKPMREVGLRNKKDAGLFVAAGRSSTAAKKPDARQNATRAASLQKN